MAEKKEEKKDEKAAAEKPEATPEEAAAKAKKRKLLLFVVAGVVLTAGIGAGLAFFLAGGSEAKMAAKTPVEGEHKEEAKKEGEHKEEAKKEGEHKEEAKKEGEHGKEEAKKEGEHGKEGEKKDAPKLAKADNIDFGCTMAFQPFHLNLGNPLENRYVRLEISVEYGCNDETKAELEKRLPQLKDAVIAVTRRKTREFLLGPDGMEQLRKEIQTRVNHYMSRKIDDVFITDILIE